MRLVDRIRPDYVRPTCPECGQTMQFVHFNGEGSRYACLPCELGCEGEDWCRPGTNDGSIGAAEASWIIRNTQGNEGPVRRREIEAAGKPLIDEGWRNRRASIRQDER